MALTTQAISSYFLTNMQDFFFCNQCQAYYVDTMKCPLCSKDQSNYLQGWQCPICSTVYAPFKDKCDNDHSSTPGVLSFKG